jgi:hypothetical protein
LIHVEFEFDNDERTGARSEGPLDADWFFAGGVTVIEPLMNTKS